MAIVKVAQVLLLLSASVAVIHGFGLRRYAREAAQKADCGSNITIGYCQACVNPELECFECPDDHILSNDKKACIKCPDHCEDSSCVEETTAPGTARCEQCQSGFTLQKSGTCAECGYYCDSCEIGAGKCDKDHCNSTGLEVGVVYSNESNTCIQCPPSCLECLVNGPTGCDVGKCALRTWYDSSTKTCKDCAAHCKSCLNSGEGECDVGQCDSGYFLQTEATATCLQCDPDCTKCDNVKEPGKCDGQQYCNSSTYYDKSSKTCKPCAENCESCIVKGNGRCDENKCKEGYGLKPEFVCDDCPPNCKTCDWEPNAREFSCTQCVDSYQKITRKTCDFCPDNCKVCTLKNGKPWCSECYKTYTKNSNDGSCDACPDNCDDCTNDHTRCVRDGCQSGYVFKVADGSCNQCASNCLTCSFDTDGEKLCQKCEQGYAVSENFVSCERCPDYCLECRMYDGELRCMRDGCESGFYIDNGRCTACSDTNCDICDDEKCYVCKSEPDALFALDSSNGCQLCANCKSGCTLKNGRAECGECKEKFVLDDSDRTCTDCPDNCKVCKLDDNNVALCTKTGCSDEFFYVKNGKHCVACPTGCDCVADPDCTGSDVISGYVQALTATPEDNSRANSIVACPPDCKTCTFDPVKAKTECDECKDGMYTVASDKTCKQCASGCETCQAAGAGNCDPEECYDGYYYHATSTGCKKCGLKHCRTCAPTEQNPNECSACVDGYGFNDDNECDQCAPSCKTCATAGAGYCDTTACNDGYYYETASETCKKCELQHCKSCTESDPAACTECMDNYGFNLAGTACSTKCPTNCLQCTVDAENVVTCNTDFCEPDHGELVITAPDDNCWPCPAACASCTLSATSLVLDCIECKPGFTLVDKTCFPCVAGCKTCSYTSDASKAYTTCTRCMDGYAPPTSSNTCMKCPVDCLSCKMNDAETKTVCDYGKCADDKFQKIEEPERECTGCPYGCKACTYDGTKTLCLPGACKKNYYFEISASRNECILCPPNCDYCDKDGCWKQRCETGYGIDNRPSDLSCYSCGEGCDKCTIETESGKHKPSCYDCKEGYVLNGEKCEICGAHCTECTVSGEKVKCTPGKCEEKFALNAEATDINSACEPCPSHCDQCTYDSDSGTVCVSGKCETGYRNVEDGSCEACDPNCKQCDSADVGQCDSGQCNDGYALTDEKKCELCDPNCNQCDSAGAGKCNRGSCNETRYAYDSTSETCLACPNNCLKCKVNSGAVECDTRGCEPGYGLQKSKNTCVKCPFNCLKCDESDDDQTIMICSTCEDQYVLNEGDCGACPRHCLKCSESKDGLTCTECNNGTTMLSDSTCQPCPDHCKVCSHTGDQVKCNADHCDPGYGRSRFGQCEECSTMTFSHCSVCTDASPLTAKSECSACDEGYALSEDSSSCISCSSLSCAGGPCRDRLYVCKDCNVGYLKTPDDTGCGIECYKCELGDGCDGGPLLDNDNVTICPIAEKGVGCWMNLYINEDGTEVRSRGCMTDNANYTCTDAYEEKQQCITLENGEQLCRRCCRSHRCNTDPLVANSVTMIASVTLLIIMVFVAMVMPDQRCRV